jgi:hypothetical protein
MIRGAFQLLPYVHRPRYPWLDTLPAPLREALREARPPESPPRVIVAGGWLYYLCAPRIDLRSAGWRRWLASADGEAWLASPDGERWLQGRGRKWREP